MKALLVIDMQKGYTERYDSGLTAAINRRIGEAKAKGELVVYIENVRRQKGVRVVNEFAEGLDVCSPHICFKEQVSALSDELLSLLRKNDVSALDVVGIDGCCCVARSASEAKTLGYSVTIPCAFVGVSNPGRFEKKKALLQKQGINVIE